MKIALISIAKPERGTGNGTTTYSYELMVRLRRMGNTVDSYYGIAKSRRYDIVGLTKMTALFPREIAKIAKIDYDIVHITMQELGFAAKILKQNGSRAKVVTTIHDLIRFDEAFEKGILERTYNAIVKRNIADAVKYSDFLLFNSQQTKGDVVRTFGGIGANKVILHGIRKSFGKEEHEKKKGHVFIVGYVGSFTRNKNVVAVLKVARILRYDNSIRFEVHGSGAEHDAIFKYKKDNTIDNVALYGPVPERDIVKIYDGFDAYMMPSLSEGFSHVILEAQARGLPVIIFEGARIPKETARYCIMAHDEKDVARIIRRIKAFGPNKVRIKKAKVYARTFTWDRTVKQSLNIYKTIVR